MNMKEVFKTIIALRQAEMPFDVIGRDELLPLDRKKIITIPGVRRCGKSSMMEITINRLIEKGVDKKRILWLGFDDERLRSVCTENLDEILKAYLEMFPDIALKDVYMFFDEIQLVKDWEYFVLRVYKNYCKNIYVCGSNATMLSTELTTALRGYPLEYETLPLSFNEYCRFKGIKTDTYLESEQAVLRNTFRNFNAKGGFPEVALAATESERLKILNAYFNTMLLKDLAEHYSITNTNVARYFVKRIMNNITKPTSINSIFNDIKSQGLKISKDELYLWANYVCAVFMFIKVPKFEYSMVKEENSLFKYYCIDNGLRGAVMMPQSDDYGKNLENTVFLHLYRTKGVDGKVCYYKDKTECDFLVRKGDCVDSLIQVSWDISNSQTFEREVHGLTDAAVATGCENLFIITDDDERTITADGKIINVVPAWKYLLK